MHAWSAVQHALDYKGEWDVPEHLKKDINALSALFYVADTEFASVYQAREESMRMASEISRPSERDTHPINLDTIRAYALERFPDRDLGGIDSFSALVHELGRSGYSTIGEVHREMERSEDALALEEDIRESRYQAVGAMRVSLGMVSPVFSQIVYGREEAFTKNVIKLARRQ